MNSSSNMGGIETGNERMDLLYGAVVSCPNVFDFNKGFSRSILLSGAIISTLGAAGKSKTVKK